MSAAASTLEVSWTVIAGFGLLFSAWLAFAGWRDLGAVRGAIREVPPRARAWGPRWWVALSAAVSNGVLCYPWLVFMAIGLIAMTYPPPPPTAEQRVSSQWFGWLLISAELAIAFVQAWHLFVRHRVESVVRWPT